MVTDNQSNIILQKYPLLTFKSEESCFVGEIEIEEDDKYNLKIDINNTSSFPKVYELNDRIPKKADRHINPDYSLCFTTKANEQILLKTQVKNLISFFDLILVPYLLNNSFYEINKSYIFGEYSHNHHISTYETYCDILSINNFHLISTLLNEVSKGRKIRPNEICYCGSGLKIKKCGNHEAGYRNIKKLDSLKLSQDSIKINELREGLIKMKNNKSA
ncbi:hypothetical protein [Tenacibaculum dicentrarchi]|uniref:hypothetical protein n=1 Tax=Tenacibaculum dicentrarchi TaxID=669041 RepID=UPI0035193900